MTIITAPSNPPPGATITRGVATTFAWHEIMNASKPVVLSWATVLFEKNNSIFTKILGEAWLRQASHSHEIKGLGAAKAKLDKDNRDLKLKHLAHTNELTQLRKYHKEAMRRPQPRILTSWRIRRRSQRTARRLPLSWTRHKRIPREPCKA